jgi:hypothetical protein
VVLQLGGWFRVIATYSVLIMSNFVKEKEGRK